MLCQGQRAAPIPINIVPFSYTIDSKVIVLPVVGSATSVQAVTLAKLFQTQLSDLWPFCVRIW